MTLETKTSRQHGEKGSGVVTLMLVGDTNIQNRDDPAEAFRHVLPILQQADLLFGQLEGPLSPPSKDPLAPDIPHKERWHHSDPRMVKGLVAAGFTGVSCASNVTYPAQAALNTITTLDEAGIKHCGFGRNNIEAHKPALIEKNGVTFGFLSYTSVFWPIGHAAGEHTSGVATIKAYTAYQPGRRTLEMPGAPPTIVTFPDEGELAVMEEDVRRLRQQTDIVVVSCHWGVSSSYKVVDYQRKIGHTAIEAGADIVFGHHPHVIQEIEVYKGKPIFYSMGNFAFDWEKMRGRNKEGLLVRCQIHQKRLAKVSFMPVQRNEENDIDVLESCRGDGRSVVEAVRTRSQEIGAELSLEDAEVVVNGVGDSR